jgi:uncharacterized membrane protein
MGERVLFKDSVEDLKELDKMRRRGWSILVLFAQFGLVLVFFVLFDIFGLIAAFFLLLFVMPRPFVLVPSSYSITKDSIIYDGGAKVTLDHRFRVKLNKDKSYVAVLKRNKEMMWLYSHDAERLYNILDKILSDKISGRAIPYHKK